MTSFRASLSRKNVSGYAVATIVAVCVFVFANWFLLPRRVGDGTEYYGMYFAWFLDHRPFMTPHSWSALAQLGHSNTIREFVPAAQLAETFPKLHLGETSDFNHFWMYSLLAAVVSSMASYLGLPLGAHSAFMLLHATLVGGVLWLAHYTDGWRGLLAMITLSLLSPLIWYVDKVHTELFTYCLCSAAVISLCGKRYFLSSLLFALTSTQNISFAAIAIAPLIFSVIERTADHRFSPAQVIAAALTLLLAVLHPLYYFFRYGTIDPQLIAGGAKIGGNAKYFYVWLLDPDIGLFPNWPLGVVLIAVCLWLYLTRKSASGTATNCIDADSALSRRTYFVFCAWFLLINLYAQSSTDKLNSGATPGLARYATWYIPIFYPAQVALLSALHRGWSRRTPALIVAWCALAMCALGCAAFTFAWQRPELSEAGYVAPSPVSLYVQTHFPGLYNPSPEIFAKRYGGAGESPELFNALAIVGPDCRKLFIGNGSTRLYGLARCSYDEARLAEVVRRIRSSSGPHTYVRLNDQQVDESLAVCPSSLTFSTKDDHFDSIVKGLSGAEAWGRWSDGPQAYIGCVSNGATSAQITAKGYSPNGRTQRMIITVNDSRALTYVFSGLEQTVDVPLNGAKEKHLSLKFSFPDAIAPSEVSTSVDNRKLAIGFVSMQLK
jgi:hypothetical protein